MKDTTNESFVIPRDKIPDLDLPPAVWESMELTFKFWQTFEDLGFKKYNAQITKIRQRQYNEAIKIVKAWRKQKHFGNSAEN